MGGQNIFDLISQGISELLNSKLGFLEASGLNLFRGLAIIMIAWYGIKAAVSSAQGGEGFNFAKFADMLLLIAFGFAMLTYYTNPLPGMDHSFSELVTKQASYVSAEIGGNQAESITRAISTAEEQLGSPPGTFSFHEELTYFFVYTLLAVTQGVALAVIAYGFVATAVLRLARAGLHSILYRRQARLAVLGMVSGIHGIFALPSRCKCLHLHRRKGPARSPWGNRTAHYFECLCTYAGVDRHAGRLRLRPDQDSRTDQRNH